MVFRFFSATKRTWFKVLSFQPFSQRIVAYAALFPAFVINRAAAAPNVLFDQLREPFVRACITPDSIAVCHSSSLQHDFRQLDRRKILFLILCTAVGLSHTPDKLIE